MGMTADVESGFGVGPENEFVDEILMNLTLMRSREWRLKWRNELFSRQTVDFPNKSAVPAWHEAIYRQHGPRSSKAR